MAYALCAEIGSKNETTLLTSIQHTKIYRKMLSSFSILDSKLFTAYSSTPTNAITSHCTHLITLYTHRHAVAAIRLDIRFVDATKILVLLILLYAVSYHLTHIRIRRSHSHLQHNSTGVTHLQLGASQYVQVADEHP